MVTKRLLPLLPLALAGLFLILIVKTCAVPPPLDLPDYRDSLEHERLVWAEAAGAWATQKSLLQATIDSAIRDSRTAKAEAERLRARRGVPVPVTYVPTPGTPDSTLMVPKADYDSLAAEADSLWSVVRADSVALTAQYARIQADSSAFSALARLREQESRISGQAITALQRDLARARRSGCFLGLPKPIIGPGYGLALVNGQAGHGPTFTVTIPIGGCRR